MLVSFDAESINSIDTVVYFGPYVFMTVLYLLI